MTADEQINEIAELCRKHGCTPEALCASVSLNPIPESLRTLGNKLERAAVFAKVKTVLKMMSEQDRINEAAAYVEPNPFYDKVQAFLKRALKEKNLGDAFFAAIDACIFNRTEDPALIPADKVPSEIYDLTVSDNSEMYFAVRAWFKAPCSEVYLSEYIGLCKRHNISPWKLHKEKNIGNHFTSLDPIAIKRVMYEAMKRLGNNPELNQPNEAQLNNALPQILHDLKVVSIKHSEAASKIRNLLDGLQSSCLGPINFEAESNSVELQIALGQVSLKYDNKDWSFASTERLFEIEVTLGSILLGEFAGWVKSNLKRESSS